ncbi:hypothetical protein A7D00_0653 [Trichophyton violaceum]|uniref:SH3 domain-containing protein n=1 Tax=Trichophyton violaceum TaxID=34388 RepID=A0A178FT42_TRIVO|nr:hypothetical protein A7D00_0653 [Trichophyton violaceum]
MARHGHRHRARKHPSIDDIIDNIDDIFKDNDRKSGSTITSVIYVTAKPTFSGPIGGYSTATEDRDRPKITPFPPLETPTRSTRRPRPTETSDEGETETPTPEPTPEPTTERTPTTTRRPPSSSSSSSSQPSSHSTPAPTTSSDRDFTTSTLAPTRTIATNSNDAAMETASGSSSATAVPGAGGMSSGAKAGLAIGLIALAAIIGGAIFFFLRKRKREQELQEIDNEKSFSNAAASFPPPPASRPTTSTTSPVAPKLNIRPVTQFSPDFGSPLPGAAKAPGVLNVSGSLPTPPASAGGSRSLTDGPGPSALVKSHTATNSDPFNDPVNPFDNPSSAPSSPPNRTLPEALQVRTPSVGSDVSRPVSPVSEGTVNTGVVASASALSAVTTSAAAVASVRSSEDARKDQPPPPPQQQQQQQPAPPQVSAAAPAPSSPAMSTASVVNVAPAPAGAPAGPPPGPNNVYRVQLDFNPSMDDELPLRAGQLVRMLHEYDDGWALCVRLDQPQQGVAPRTCLSSRPVRPRPRGPPQGPGQRTPIPGAMPPAGGPNSPGPNPNSPRFNPPVNSRPASPNAGYRPYPPPQNKFNEIPRSLSPGPGAGSPRIPQPRSMSPGPYGPGGMEKPVMPAAQRPRSNSAGVAAAPATPAPAPAAVSEEPVVKPEPSRSPPPALGPANRKPVPGQEN